MNGVPDTDPGRYRLPRASVVIVLLTGVLQAVALVAFILIARRLLDLLVPTDVGAAAAAAHIDALWGTALLAGIGVVLGLLRAIEFSVAEKAGYEVVRRLRMDMYEHLTRMMPHQLRHRARGGLLLRLTGDLSMLRMWLSRGLLQGAVAALVLTVGIVATFVLNPWIGVVMVAAYALLVTVSVANGHVMRDATRRMRRRRSLVIGNIDEQINSLAVVQTAGRVGGEYARLSRQNDSLNRALCRVAELRGRLRGLTAAGTYLVTAAVLAIGIVEVRRGITTVAVVLICVVIAQFLSRPVRTLGLAHDYWHRGQVSRQKVDEFLRSSARPTEDSSAPLRIPNGDIEFRSVTVPGAVEGLSASIPRRTVLGITGPAGSGKSTIIALLARLVEPTEGEIVIDDHRLSDTSWSSAGRRIGIASPDLPLLRGTIRRNLTYRAPEATAAEIQRVMYQLSIDDVAGSHGSASVETWLTEGGGNVSPRDRQLIKIGRALMDNPRLLLLDEPTAGLDRETAERVRECLARYQGTVVLVSNDDEDLALADVVWHMDKGRLVEAVDGLTHQARAWNETHRGSVTCRQPAHVH